MKSPRWMVVGACAGALVLAGVLPPTLASATTPTSTPTITSPDGTSAITSSPLSVSATSTDSDPQAFVRFVLDGGHGGIYVADANINGAGNASGTMPVVGLDGGVDLVAYDCDGSVTPADCNTAAPATVHLTINLPSPAITAPANGATRQDSVTVNVDDSNGGGLNFSLDGGPPQFDTSGPPYSHVFSLLGLAQGPHTVKVTQCNNDGTVCQGPSDSVNFTRDTSPNSTPTITSPNAGATIGTGPMTVTATSTDSNAQAFVRFVLDGGHSGIYVADAPINGAGNASTTMPVAGLDGGANLVAYDCDGQVTPAVCNTGSPDTVHVTIDLPAPVIQFPATNGEHFRASVDVAVDGAAGAMRFSLSPGGTVVETAGPPYLHTFDITGMADGATGTITVTQCDSSGTVCQGKQASVSFVRDTSGPTWTPASASPKTFYPGKDPGREYRDRTRLATHVQEQTTGVRLVIRNVHNRKVRTVTLPNQSGKIAWTWNGRNDAKKPVSAGTYSFRFSGLDATANPGSSDPGTVVVSNKVLHKRTFRPVVTPMGSHPEAGKSTCGAAFPLGPATAKPFFRHGIGYYSNYYCNKGLKQSLASVTHHIRIPAASRFGKVRVDVYGAAARKHGGASRVCYWPPGRGSTCAHSAVIGPKVGWHHGHQVALAPLVTAHTFRWAAYTYKGAWYNVAKFRVVFSVYTLGRPRHHRR